jgi:propanol-preferring alcohol dehydrogenase
VLISGVGGLGHVAIQYARAMGLHVVALDVHPDKLKLARELGAELVADASDREAVGQVRKDTGGAHAVLVTASSIVAFQQALSLLRRGGTCVPVGLPAGKMEVPILNLVTRRLTIRGSIVGTRKDLQEALQFAGEGKVKCIIETAPLAKANDVFNRLRAGEINGRVVLKV